jgi:hypothetical protein
MYVYCAYAYLNINAYDFFSVVSINSHCKLKKVIKMFTAPGGIQGSPNAEHRPAEHNFLKAKV